MPNQNHINRRQFIRTGAATGAGLFVPWPVQGPVQALFGRSRVLTPFVDPLPILPVIQPTGTFQGDDQYVVWAQEVQQQLHRDMSPTTVWGYNGLYPGPTFDVQSGQGIYVQWGNDLRDSNGDLRTTHYLPVDTCLHGPNTLGASARTVVHLHGGHTPADSDGFPDLTQLPGESVNYHYPNKQESATLWYHDHAMGITRLNNYMGLSGFYLVRDALEQSLNLPEGDYEIPLVIQDRSFNADGSLLYPAAWQQQFFGDTILVNGKVWPYLDVTQRKYRFRILNGSNARTYRLYFDSGQPFYQIGSDGGLLNEAVMLQELILAPAERADVIVDFSAQSGTVTLLNSAPAPFPGQAGVGEIPNVMQFNITGPATDTSSLPISIRTITPLSENDAARTRLIDLRNASDPCTGIKWLMNGLGWNDVTEYVALDSIEVWTFQNVTGHTHPMHIHLVQFQILDRQSLNTANTRRVPPAPNEAGWKDTVLVYPRESVRVIARFSDYTGDFVYHCHNLEHEDHEMMRQFVVAANLPVVLTRFDGRIEDRSVQLFWETTSEINNAGFEIQRKSGTRTDANPYETIGFVEGSGTTVSEQSYRFQSDPMEPGAYVFRLKQIDFDGGFEYSHAIELVIELPELFELSEPYPNPFQESTRFKLLIGHEQDVQIEVFNALGQHIEEVYNGRLQAHTAHYFQFDALDMPPGLYTIRVRGTHFIQTRKVVLTK